MMADILDFEGYSISVARHGQEALKMLRSEEDFLVFLDVMMPGMNGKELCDVIEADPHLRERHIIVLMSAVDNLEEAASLKIDAVLKKPFVVEDVIRCQGTESNRRHQHFQCCALPTELPWHAISMRHTITSLP